MDILAMAVKLFTKNGMVASFMVLGLITFIAYKMGSLTKGRVHGSAIAIFLGLVLAYFGGSVTGGSKGIADIPLFAGMGLVGGAMFRDFAIVSTAFGADLREIKKIGLAGCGFPFYRRVHLPGGRYSGCLSARIYQRG